MLDQCAVPQEAHDESHKDDPDEEHEHIVQQLLAVTGIQNALHIVLYAGKKNQVQLRRS